MNQRLENRDKGPVLYASLDRLVFEGKNHQYGGYAIRSTDSKRLLGSFYFAAALILTITLVILLRGGSSPLKALISAIPDEDPYEVVTEVEMPPDVADPPKPDNPNPATPPAAQPAVDQQRFLTPEPAPIVTDQDSTPEQASIVDNPGDKTVKGTGEPPRIDDPLVVVGPPGGTGPPKDPEWNDPVDWTTEQPVATNMDKIKPQIRYPAPLLEMGMEGKVVFKVLVDEFGNYKKHVVVKTNHDLFTKACEPHLKSIEFTPGKQGKNNVKVWVIVPFDFKVRSNR